MPLLLSNPALGEFNGREGHARYEGLFSYSADVLKLAETLAEAIKNYQREAKPDRPPIERISE